MTMLHAPYTLSHEGAESLYTATCSLSVFPKENTCFILSVLHRIADRQLSVTGQPEIRSTAGVQPGGRGNEP